MKLPAATLTMTQADQILDQVCFDYVRLYWPRAEQTGLPEGYLEAVLEHNPGLSKHRPLLPLGLIIRMPAFTVTTSSSQTVRLWD